jgi:hypothetical protein
MTIDPADDDLQRQFAALREHELAAAPEFEAMWARAAVRARHAKPTSVPAPAWVAAAVVAALAISGWLVVRTPPVPTTLASIALPGWQTPTDSLLANADDPLPQPSWSTLPTASLGPSSFNRPLETR